MGINHAINEELLNENYQYKRLHDQHLEIKTEIYRARSAPLVDVAKLKFLKRKKLRLADEMFSLANK